MNDTRTGPVPQLAPCVVSHNLALGGAQIAVLRMIAALPDWVALVREKVESLRYGVVQLVVHDGRVTQIERTEKTRLATGRDAQAHE